MTIVELALDGASLAERERLAETLVCSGRGVRRVYRDCLA